MRQALRDLRGSYRALSGLFRTAFLLVLVVSLADELMQRAVADWPAGLQATRTAANLLREAVAAPLILAVHRYILIDETTTGYGLDLGQSRVKRFLALTALFVLASTVVSLSGTALAAFPAARLVVTLVLSVMLIPFMLRVLILFPAIAVDGEDGDLASIRATANGRLWQMFWKLVVGSLPTIILAFSVAGLLLIFPSRSRDLGTALMLVPLSAAMFVFALTNYAVVGARIYAELHTRGTGRQAEPAAPQS